VNLGDFFSDMDQSNLSIIIPVFNEADVITGLVKDVREAFSLAEIIVVNDGSTDGTAGQIPSEGIRVLMHERNRGYGAALKTGIRQAGREYVLFIDGDGQHPVEDVRRLVAACDGQDMVAGARDSASHRPLSRRPGKYILERYAEFLIGAKIPDLNCGLRMFKKETISRYLHLMPDSFSFSSTSTLAMIKGNRRYIFVPVTIRKRIGKSTVSQLRHGPAVLMLMLRLTVLFEPLKVFLSISGFFLLACLISFANDMISAGGLSDTTVILTIAMIIVFMFGLLCDQISSMRREKYE